MMLTLKPSRLSIPLLLSLIMLAACNSPAPTPTPLVEPSTVALVRTPAPTKAPAPTKPSTPTPLPGPTTVPNPTTDPITGAHGFARGAIGARPLVVMIDNHPAAYPQTGLNHAAIVFEALAEFGVTRFMAVYAPGLSPIVPKIGPVRSTRAYFVQWAMGFHGLYVHAGGSPQGLKLAESTDQLINLDALKKGSGGYFRRDSDRAAPHNLYTSSDELQRAAQDRGAPGFSYPEMGFLFKTDVAADQRPSSQQIGYFFIYKEDHVSWVYDPETNGYLRLRRGKAAYDAETGDQLWSKNIVVIEVHEELIDGDEKGRIDQVVVGSGKGLVFVDGVEREVVWRKLSPVAPLLFYDQNDQEIRFNAGPIWISAVPSLENVVVK